MRMRTETLIIVFIYFLDSCQLRQFLVETNDVPEDEYGTEYNDNYGLYYGNDYQPLEGKKGS